MNKFWCNLLSNHRTDFFIDDALTHIVNTHQPASYFCRNITEGLHEGWTVTFAALQLAYFLGFDTVIIIRMDHRYQFDGKPIEEWFVSGEDPNPFCSTCFGFGQTWDNPHLLNSDRSYREDRKAYENDGRVILDATLDGACEIFDKVDYREFFQLKPRENHQRELPDQRH